MANGHGGRRSGAGRPKSQVSVAVGSALLVVWEGITYEAVVKSVGKSSEGVPVVELSSFVVIRAEG